MLEEGLTGKEEKKEVKEIQTVKAFEYVWEVKWREVDNNM